MKLLLIIVSLLTEFALSMPLSSAFEIQPRIAGGQDVTNLVFSAFAGFTNIEKKFKAQPPKCLEWVQVPILNRPKCVKYRRNSRRNSRRSYKNSRPK